MPARPRDPNDPDFPHGTALGYRAGCRATYPCPGASTCSEIIRLADAERRQKVRQGVPRRYRVSELRTILRTWIDDKEWVHQPVARAAGLSRHGLEKILNGQVDSVLVSTGRRIAAITEDDLIAASTTSVPARLIRWKLGSLCANGWPAAVQGSRLGYGYTTILQIVTGHRRRVARDMLDDVNAFFDQMCAIPYTGIHHIRAKDLARRYGFRTPDDYAPDGLLWEGDIRNEKIEERWARRDREALLHMQVARMAVQYNMSLGEIAKQLRLTTPAVEDHTIRRARKALGLAWDGGKAHGPKPGQEERIAQILDVVERWRQAGELADPHPFCVELGMMDARLWTSLDGKPKLEAA